MEIENEWNSKVSPKKNCIASDDQKDKTAMYLDNCINDGSLDSNGDIVILSKTILNYLEEVSPENKDTTIEKIDEDVIDKKNNIFFRDCNDVGKKGMNLHDQNFLQSCTNLCEIFKEIQKMKSIKDKSEEIASLKRAGLIAFTSFKKYYEIARMYVQEHRDKTTMLRECGQAKYVLLDNILYEMTEVIEEIKMCARYPRYDQKLGMLSHEEYKAVMRDAGDRTFEKNTHRATLKRMDHELQERKSLNENLSQLNKAKDAKTTEIKKINEFMRGLTPKLASILETAKPLQAYLNMNVDYERSQFVIAKLLPEPLYFLFIQAKSHRDAFDSKLEVKVVGDLEQAEIFELNRSPKVVKEDGSKVSLAPDQDEQERGANDVLEKHPLSLKLTLSPRDQFTMSLWFHYCPRLNIATVTSDLVVTGEVTLNPTCTLEDIMNGNGVMHCLYHLDDGLTSPNSAVDLILREHSCESFEHLVPTLGHAYFWSQYLCGLRPSDCRHPVRYLRDTLERISSRLTGRLGLIRELVAIEKREMQTNVKPLKTHLRAVQSKISSWKRINSEEYETIVSKSRLEDIEQIKYNNDYVFRCVIEHEKATSKLFIYFFISTDYPKTTPYCLLSQEDLATQNLLDNAHIMSMQIKMNNDFASAENTLSEQICYALHACHVSDCMSSEQPQQNFKRKARGPDRYAPNAYNEKLNYFYHHKE